MRKDMKKRYTEQYIGRLIERFMSGDTTLDEERELGEYFRTARRIPQEWNIYRQMFEYFDCGMDKPKRNLLWRIGVYRAVAAVFVVALVLVAAFFRGTCHKAVSADEPVVAMAAVEHNPKAPENSAVDGPSGSGSTVMDNVPEDKAAARPNPDVHRALPSDSYDRSYIHADADDSYDPSTGLSYEEIVQREEQKKRNLYNEMKEAEYKNRLTMGECCMLVENIDGYYEVTECAPDIILL